MKRFLTLLSAGLFALATTKADAQVTQVTNRLSLTAAGNTVTLMPPGAGSREISFPAGTGNTNFLIADPTNPMTINSGGLTLGASVPLTFTGFTVGNILYVGGTGAASEDPDLTWDAVNNALSVPMLSTAGIRLSNGANYLTINAPALSDNTQVFTLPSTGGTLITESASGNVALGNDTDPLSGSVTMHDGIAGNGFTQKIQAAANAGQSSTITIPAVGAASANFVLTNTSVDQTIDDVAAITNNGNIAINPGAGSSITTDGEFELTRNVGGFATGTYNGAEISVVGSSGNTVDLVGVLSAVTGTDDNATAFRGSSTAATGSGAFSMGGNFTATGTGTGTNVGGRFSASGASTNIGLWVSDGGIQVDNGTLNLTGEGITNAGSIAGATTVDASTSVTTPSLIGSAATDGTLTVTASTGAGPQTPGNNAILFNVGDNGATTAMDIDHDGTVNIPTVNITGGSISGVALSSATLTASDATNQIVLGDFGGGAPFGTTISAVAPASGDLTYTIPDAGSDASFVMTEGTQTINGTKTFTGVTTFGTSNTPSVLLLNDANPGMETIAIVTGGVVTPDLQYSIPDAGADASFVMTEGLQTINGYTTFAGGLAGQMQTSLTNSSTDILSLYHATTMNAGADFGGSIATYLQNDNSTNSYASRLTTSWADAAAGSEDSRFAIELMSNGWLTEVMTLDGDGNLSVTGEITSGGSGFLKLSGGTMSGSINLGSQELVGSELPNGALNLVASSSTTPPNPANPAINFLVGEYSGPLTNAMTILHNGTVQIPSLEISGSFDGDFTLTKEANHSIFVAASTSPNADGGDITLAGGDGDGSGSGGNVNLNGGAGTTAGNVILNQTGGATQFMGKITYTHDDETPTLSGDVDLSNHTEIVIRILDNGAAVANTIAPPSSPIDGQVIYIVNQDADSIIAGLNMGANSTAMFVYFAGAGWIRTAN